MKLHTLELENINSLRGEHKINFEKLFDSSSILLIAGETGSGKSTLMDAIFLALYGKTPRLSTGSQSLSEDSSVRHVMTRGTGTCRVKLVFSILSEDGVREKYNAHWSMRRAHGKPGGNFQKATTGIHQWDDDTGDWIDLLKRGVFPHFEAAIHHALRGMTESDFLRSVMLAQGRFDTLLSASSEERAKALERVVSVEEVERIGNQVYEYASLARRALEDLVKRTAVEQEDRLTEADRTAHQQELTELASKREQHATTIKTLNQRVEWSKGQVQIQAELAVAEAADVAAKTAQQDSAEMAASLEEHRRVDEAARKLAIVSESRTRRSTQHEALKLAQAQENASAETQKPLQSQASTARTKHQELNAASVVRAPQLKEAYEAWELLQNATRTFNTAQETQEQGGVTFQSAQEALKTRNEALETCKAQTKTAQEDVARFELEERALASLPEIEILREELVPLEAKLSNEAGVLKRETSRREEASGALAKLQSEKTTLLESQKTWLQELGELRDVAELEGVEALNLRSADAIRDALKNDQDNLRTFGEELRAIEDRSKALREAQATVTRQSEQGVALKAELEREEVAEKALAEQRANQASILSALRELLGTQRRFLELVEELKPGSDCPLCGSDEHKPGDERQKEMLLARDQTSEKLRVAEDADKTLQTKFDLQQAANRKRSDELTELRTSTKWATDRLRELEGEQERGVSALREKHPRRATTVSFEPEALGATLSGLRDTFAMLKSQLAEAEALKTTAEELQLALNRNQATLESLHASQKTVADDLAAASQRHADLQQKINLHLQRAEGIFATAMFARWAPTTETEALEERLAAYRTALANLAAQLKAFEKALAQRNLQREREENAAAEVKGQAATVALTRTAWEAAVAKTKEAETRAQSAQAHSKKFFEGESPREVQDRFNAELAKANEVATQLEQKLEQAKTLHLDLEKKRSAAEAVLKQILTQLEEQDAAFRAELAELELPDEDAVIARRLDEEQAKLLNEHVTKVADELKRAQVELNGVTTRLTTHQEKRATIGEPDPSDEETLERALLENTAFIERASVIQTHLKTDDDRMKKLGESEAKLAELTRERDEWVQLSGLIGTERGAAFKEFALALSLGELIVHANEQLKHIAPRYVLRQRFSKTNVPEIDFEIIDRDFSDHVRPVTNISGGERFQLSLAMALGLSSMARSVLPIETLLIDEGFGTLDPETLDKAIQTLESLYQRTGARVALISHVESLRERLPTQIMIRKRGGGHSDLEQIDGFGLDSIV